MASRRQRTSKREPMLHARAGTMAPRLSAQCSARARSATVKVMPRDTGA